MTTFTSNLPSRFKEFILLFNLLICLSASAQDKNIQGLEGIVLNQDGKPVDGAAVYALKRSDSSVVKIEISDQKGFFSFNTLMPGSYLIKITSIAYKGALYGPFVINEGNQTVSVGHLKISNVATNLQEVSIYENPRFIETRPGKVILNVENSILSKGSTAYDMLRTAPGVQMDADDNIRLHGKQNVLVILNGKQTFLEKEALIDILKGTQGNEIDQIELISNPSAKYDAAGSGAIINIKTKKNKSFGANGSVSGMSGISLLSSQYEPNYRYNGALNLNYRNKLVNLFGSYNYADFDQNRVINLDRQINNSNRTSFDINYESFIQRITNTYRLGLDLNLNANHVIGVLVNGSKNNIGIGKNNFSNISNFNVLDSTIRAGSDQERFLTNRVLNFNYRGKLGKKFGEISFDADFINNDRSSDELLTNDFFAADNSKYRESILLRTSSPSEYDVRSFKLDYALSLSAKTKLELGVQQSQVQGRSNLDFGQIVSSVFMPDSRFVNDFSIDERISAGYINYSIDFKKSNLYVGLRAEKTVSDGLSSASTQATKRDYLNLFPNLQFSQTINQNNQLLLSYSRRITRPGYDNLNPFVAYVDQYSYRSGNPLLQPEFVQIVEVANNYKNKYTATLRAKRVDDLIIDLNEQDDNTRVNTSISRNFNRQNLYGIELNAPVDLSSWWNMNLNLESNYETYVTVAGTEDFVNSSPSAIFSALHSFKFKNDFGAEINGKYESPTVYGIYNFKSAYSVDFGLAKSFFNKEASIRLRVTDLFNTASNRYSSTFRNLNMQLFDKRDSMMGQLSFTYLFGRNTVTGARRRDTGSESQQERIGN